MTVDFTVTAFQPEGHQGQFCAYSMCLEWPSVAKIIIRLSSVSVSHDISTHSRQTGFCLLCYMGLVQESDPGDESLK